MEGQYNMRSPAVKRLMREARELKDASPQYHAQPLEDNLFEWHFTVAGPPDTAFSGGRYHGRILLPPEYPMKPPSIIILTPNGRFEVGSKICLSVSGHHPETWQPSWSIRTVLIALMGFMPTKGGGAIAALDYTPEERHRLARRSRDWTCPSCGLCMRDALPEGDTNSSVEDSKEQELAAQINFKGEKDKKVSTQKSENSGTDPSSSKASEETDSAPSAETPAAAGVSETFPSTPGQSGESSLRHRQHSPPTNKTSQREQTQPVHENDWMWQAIIWFLVIAIVSLIARRLFFL